MYVEPANKVHRHGAVVTGNTYAEISAKVPASSYLIVVEIRLRNGVDNYLAQRIDAEKDFLFWQNLLQINARKSIVFYSVSSFIPFFTLKFVDVPTLPPEGRSVFYFPYTLDTKASRLDPAVLVQDYTVAAPSWDEKANSWTIPAPETKPVEIKRASQCLPGYLQSLRLSESPAAPLKGSVLVNLSVGNSFHVPLSSEGFVFAQFSCTDGSISWDGVDLPKLQGAAKDAIDAGLLSKCVLIGDNTDTFEYNGVRSPGPLVFRTPSSAAQIIWDSDESIYRVTFMLLQPMSDGGSSLLIADLMKRVASLEQDTVAPKLVMLDEIPPIVTGGLHEIGIRVYIDD